MTARILALILASVPVSTPVSSSAQYAGEINLYADPDFTSTVAFDTEPGTLSVYVVLEGGTDPFTTAVLFGVGGSSGFTGVWIGETVHASPYFNGTSPGGIAIAFASCVGFPIHLMTITYATTGTSATCSFLEVVPRPEDQFIEICDCVVQCLGPGIGQGGKLTVNPGDGCTSPVEQSTWGKIKVLYDG